MNAYSFSPPPPSPEAEALRLEVRDLLRTELADRKPLEKAESWTGMDANFSRKMDQRGWIGMTWPKRYGGHERSSLERCVVLEEMLAAAAPVALHWIADRQSGPLIRRVGTDEQKTILPKIVAGEAFFCIGMSEPDVGSDLASVRTRAAKVQGAFVVTGLKVWTSFADKLHYITLRRLSWSVAGMLLAGENPALQATLVKDLGALAEQEIPKIARSWLTRSLT